MRTVALPQKVPALDNGGNKVLKKLCLLLLLLIQAVQIGADETRQPMPVPIGSNPIFNRDGTRPEAKEVVYMLLDKKSPTGVFIPTNIQDAALEFRSMLSQQDWNAVVNAVSQDLDCNKEVKGIDDISYFIETKWMLKATNSEFGIWLRTKRFYDPDQFEASPRWVGRALCVAAYQQSLGENIDLRRLEANAVIEYFDRFWPLKVPPSKCTDLQGEQLNDALISTVANVFPQEPWYQRRIIYWIACNDNQSATYYLWGIGWQMTDRKTLEAIAKSDEGGFFLAIELQATP